MIQKPDHELRSRWAKDNANISGQVWVSMKDMVET